MNSNNEIRDAVQQHSNNNAVAKSDEQICIDYLLANQDFFQHHAKLLEQLSLKHSTGKAVSLIERQVEILRQQNTQLKSQLNSLVAIAQENESFTQKMQTLTLDLLASHDIDGINNILQHRIVNEFSADCVSLQLFSPKIDNLNENVSLDIDSKQAKALLKIMHKREPVCGFFKTLDLQQLFKNSSTQIGSMAVIPLYIDKNNCFGALLLGSANLHQFSPNMGTIFLENLAEVMSYAIYKYLKPSR